MSSHEDEFPENQDRPPTEKGRREFLRLMSASMALAGASGCSRAPHGEIVPYAVQPPEVIPGVPSHYATTLTRAGYGIGVVGESHEGRPTKIEGNPFHPMSLGGSGAFEQASLLGLYDRDRGKAPARRGEPSSMREILADLASKQADRGAGTHFLLEPTSSPTTVDLLMRVRDRLSQSHVYFHSSLSPKNTWAGAKLAFGVVREAHYHFRNADVVVAIDSDFLMSGPAQLRYARHFAERRTREGAPAVMNRLYVVEPTPTITGGQGDHRLRMTRAEIPRLASALVAEIVARARDRVPAEVATAIGALHGLAEAEKRWISSVATDLLSHRSRSLIVVGEAQPPFVHALAFVANAALGNFGTTLDLTPSCIHEAAEPSHSLRGLVDALDAGDVDTLVILGGNPAYASAQDLKFARRLRRASRSLYLGPYENETASASEYYVPQAHALESWGDARASDGTTSIVQPLRAPLPGARTHDEILAYFTGDLRSNVEPESHDLLRDTWRRSQASDFAAFWTHSLTRGLVAGSAYARTPPSFEWSRLASTIASLSFPKSESSLELVINEDTRMRDGAMTNNVWLMELPDPVHKLTWENAAVIGKSTAATLGVSTGDIVTMTAGSIKVEAPILVVPGVADGAVSLALGYGRQGSEQIANGVGVNAYALQSSDSPWQRGDILVEKTSRRARLALAQDHFSLHGRAEDIFLRRTVAEFERDPDFARPQNAEKKSLYVLPQGAAHQWGMVIDLSACTGCSACVVACQAENNTSVVGKEGVMKAREMQWIRIDRYVVGDTDDAAYLSQPMLCQHCERAPCEYVCPVNATTHSADGLNQMIYNRCVGTRFCSNNCPWKVRRFNWFDLAINEFAIEPACRNPDVTVRGRGVMEKCTYCVQRIREAEIHAEVEARPLGDREFKTACEEACPSAAIVFGDIADPNTAVSHARRSPRLYAVLNDLGTVPHTRYLAKIDNPNGELA